MPVSLTSEVTGSPGVSPGFGFRSIEEAACFGLSHRIRIEVLAALHDKPASAPVLAKMLGEPRERLRYHIEELLKDGSIEIAAEEMAGNMGSHIYRVTKLGFNSDADWQAMPIEDRQVECAAILKATWTEALAALWAGKFRTDPQVANIWNRLLLDEQGRNELADEQARSFQAIETIEGHAATRRAASGGKGKRYVVATFGYERGRSSPPEPQAQEDGIRGSATDPTKLAMSGHPVEEAISKAIKHRIRIEILAALHEGPATATDLSKLLGQPIGVVHYHVRRLLKDGSIGVSDTPRHMRNLEMPVYTALILPVYDEERWDRLAPEERQVLSAVTLRAAMAESLTALWAGKLHSDPRLMLAWKPIVLDDEGRRALTQEQRRSWRQICAIESSAQARLGEEETRGTMHVVTLLGFERSRT